MPKKKTITEKVKSKEQEVQITVTLVPIDKIDDNPYNIRQHYPGDAIREMAESIRDIGLRQPPTGRRLANGHVQLAFGHVRFRAFQYGDKNITSMSWKTMPVVVRELSDNEMFDYAMEENLRRTNVSPIEVARAIEAYTKAFPDVKDKDIAAKHSMSEANISNMRRVLRLPEKFLTMIDEGKLSFTQGRELLTLEGIPDAETVMTEAVEGLVFPGAQLDLFKDSLSNTVGNLQINIHRVMRETFSLVSNESAPFDVIVAGCFHCDKCITTHPSKGKTAEFCTDTECWNKKAEEFKNAPHATQQAATPPAEKTADISQEKSTKGTAGDLIHAIHTNDAERVAELTQPPATTEDQTEKKEKPAATPAAVVKNAKLRKIIVEEKEDGVTVSIMSEKGLSIEGLTGSLEDSLMKLPELLAKSMKGA